MTEESSRMASDCRWEKGEVTGMSCLIRVVWRERRKKSLGSAASEREND